MNNKEDALKKVENFLKSDKKCMLVIGTHQFKKHILVMYAINEYCENARVLFRANTLENITNRSFLGKFINKKPKAGEIFKISNNYYSFDTYRQDTWWKSKVEYDFAILYPIGGIVNGGISPECVGNLFNDKRINKIFLVSCTDNAEDDYSEIENYIDEKTIYDAEEEDIHYHRRMLVLED